MANIYKKSNLLHKFFCALLSAPASFLNESGFKLLIKAFLIYNFVLFFYRYQQNLKAHCRKLHCLFAKPKPGEVSLKPQGCEYSNIAMHPTEVGARNFLWYLICLVFTL